MKLTGPLICFFTGLLIFALAWMSNFGPPDHNIGRGIAHSIMRQAFGVLGGLISFAGLIWFVLRWFEGPTT